jgi:hypothetical protein
MSTLTDESKLAEEKMWSSFRESESRETVLRKELHKLQKAESSARSAAEKLQGQLKV